MAASNTTKVLETEADVSRALCDLVNRKAVSAIEERGVFTIGVSGGSAAKFLCNGLSTSSTDWSKWRVFFCDERHVPFSDPECTYSYYKTNLMSVVPLLEEHVYPLTQDLSVEEAAADYERKLKTVFPADGLPKFDVLVLGMGPDGHTCSLFPGHPLLNETEKLAAPISDSPKPPPCRVTLTLPVINNALCAVFASCGVGKADIVQKVLEDTSGEPLPAARVKPRNGEVVWLLDEGAASKLRNKDNLQKL